MLVGVVLFAMIMLACEAHLRVQSIGHHDGGAAVCTVITAMLKMVRTLDRETTARRQWIESKLSAPRGDCLAVLAGGFQ